MENRFKIFKGNGVLASYQDTIEDAMSSCDENKGWYFEKEGTLTKAELYYKVVRQCVNKELEIYGLTYNHVKKGASFEYWTETIETEEEFFWFFKRKKKKKIEKPWYQFLVFKTEEEYNDWKKFCINLFKKELKMKKGEAEYEFTMFDLKYGLKQQYLYD